MRKKDIDLVDLKIIHILSTAGGTSNKDLAKQIGLSPAPTLVRVRRLFEKGIFTNYQIQIDYKAFGYISCVSFLVTLLQKNLSKLKDLLHQSPHTFNYYRRINNKEISKEVIKVRFEMCIKDTDEINQMEEAIYKIPDILNIEIFSLAPLFNKEKQQHEIITPGDI